LTELTTSIEAIKAGLIQRQDEFGLTEIPDRLSRIRKRIKEAGLDALIINRSANVVYATGFSGIADEENPHVALITADVAIAFLDSRYYEVASAQAVGAQWEAVLARHEVRAKAIEAIEGLSVQRIGIEDTMSYGQFVRWTEALDTYEIEATHRLVEEVREIKDIDELARIAQAQAIADDAFAYILTFIKQGMTEKEIAFELELALRRRGAEALAFDPIVAAGSSGSMPHAKPSDYRIEKGDLITLDFGAQVDGYKSDMTRTICVGKANNLQKSVYKTVLEAQIAGIAALHATATCDQVDNAARSVIDAAGYGEEFGHGTGHGVGLDIHELPSLKPSSILKPGEDAKPQSEATLKTGSVVTMEPGIYIPGKLGVRIEDLALVTKGGCHIFTSSPKDLIELDI
jgi:Xaa-Pro aminopeptidase